jgi:hypothetical protein
VVLRALYVALLAGADVSVGCGVGLLAIDMRLAPLQGTNFTVGQRAIVDTVGNPLRRRRVGITRESVVLVGVECGGGRRT